MINIKNSAHDLGDISNKNEEEQRISDFLLSHELLDTPFFTGDTYITAIIGITDEGRLVYDYDKMVDYLRTREPEMSWSDAAEWIDYNVIRTVPYMGDLHPIIYFPVEDL